MGSGGKRKGAGRKPIEDKKQTITLFVKSSKVEKEGGKDVLREKIYKLLGIY